ncbi:MAG: hypothetical protein HY236_17640 [Acidobacteria bacterium]|nr:hypothetical protein [Acidobacteriota bacterium]
MAVRQKAGLRDRAPGLEVARVLLVEGDVAARLTLQAVLEASGYAVDSAASAPEAMDKLEHDEYALVLCGLHADTRSECRRVVDHARAQEYKPATAYLTASGLEAASKREGSKTGRLLIEPQEVPALLTKIADLLADRAAGRERRNMRRRHAELVSVN